MPKRAVREITTHQGHRFKWANQWCLALPSGGVFFEDMDTLLVADLHLEKASYYARFGQFVPPYDTTKTVQKLERDIEQINPRTIVSLGDSFHDSESYERIPAAEKQRFIALTHLTQWVWISGNHDPHAGLPGQIVRSHHLIGDVTCVHIASGNNSRSGYEISGHFHPCATIVQRGRRLRCRCIIYDDQKMILPAYGSLTGSLNISSDIFDGIIDRVRQKIILLGDSDCYPMANQKIVKGH